MPSLNQEFVLKIRNIILENLADGKFGSEELIKMSGMSRYKLSRKLQSDTGRNINQFIREVRLEKSLEMLRQGTMTISEIAYRTGFGSPAYFNKCFHDFYGYSPSQVKNNPDRARSESETGNTVRRQSVKFVYALPAGFIILVIFFVYQAINREKVSPGMPGIAVMPFENLTGNPDWDYLERAIQRDLISALVLSGELEVREESWIDALLKKSGAFESSISPSSARLISKKLRAEYFINGSIQKFEQEVRIDAHLIRTSKGMVIKSFEKTDTYVSNNTLMSMIDTIRHKVTDHLLIAGIISKNPYYQHLFTTPRSAEAMKYYDYAFKSFNPAEKVRWLRQAVAADSGFYRAELALEYAYGANNQVDSSRIWLIKNFRNRFKMSEQDRLDAGWAYSFTFESSDEQIKYLTGLSKIDEQDPSIHYLIGIIQCFAGNYDKAVQELEISMKIFKRWGDEFLKDTRNIRNFKWLGIAYHNTGQYRKEKRLYNKAAKFIEGSPFFNLMNSMVALHEKDSSAVAMHLGMAEANFRKYTMTIVDIKIEIGRYFAHAAVFDLAEKYLREALALAPESIKPIYMYGDFCRLSGKFSDADIMEKGMRLAPDKQTYCEFLAMKGMCLYSQGKKDEGHQLIEKAWNEAPFRIFMLKDFLRKTAS